MAAFEYQALNPQGHAVKGVMEGDAERQVRALLREKGLTPLRVDVIDQRAEAGRSKWSFSFRRGIPGSELALLTRQFATLIHAGLTIEECLNALIEQTESARSRSVLAGVRTRVLEGSIMDASYTDNLLASGGCVNAYNALAGVKVHDLASNGSWNPPQAQTIDDGGAQGEGGGGGGGCFIQTAGSAHSGILVLFAIALLALFRVRPPTHQE